MTDVKRVNRLLLPKPEAMVSLPEDPDDQELRPRRPPSASILTGMFTIAGALLIWWADTQFTDIRAFRSSTFQFPKMAWALWSLTLVGAGLAFGLAVASGASWRSRLESISGLWGLIPLTLVALFHGFLAGWIEGVNVGMFQTVLSQTTRTAAALTVGVFLTGLLAPLLPEPSADS